VEEQPIGSGGQKRPHPSQQSTNSTLQKTTQGGRSRLFIGNIPSDLTQEEFQSLFGKYGELIEYYVNPSRGFGFVKLVCLFNSNKTNSFFRILEFKTIC
jgi:RNA recognition motif-containing protein